MNAFFPPAQPIAAADLAAQIDAELVREADGGMEISLVAPLEAAEPGSLSFLNNRRYAPLLAQTKAAAVIVGKNHLDQVPKHVSALLAADPYRAFAQAAALLFPTAMRPLPIFGGGVSSGAHVHEEAELEDNVTVDPGAVIGAGAKIGRDTVICAGAVIGPNVTIGRDSTIGPNVTVIHAMLGDRVILQPGACIGADGFGFAMGPGGHHKIVQLGRVILQDDVEIGPCTVIDRGSNRDTIIGEGTKIDGSVMIGHNITIGRHCVMAGKCGIAGSSEIGDFVLMGAGVSVNGHIKIGSGAQLMGKTVVVEDIPPAVQYAGDPARPLSVWRRDMVEARRDWKNRVKKMQKGKEHE